MKSITKSLSLRHLLQEQRPVRAVGAYDAITARLIERTGFEAIWASSLCISAAAGLPDAGIVSMRELLDVARILDRATEIPVIADCDNGFGTTNNVIHLINEYERAGIAAICIEDQATPKRNSLYSGQHILDSTKEFSRKIRAGVAARQTADFLIIARTEALVAGRTPNEAIERAEAYAIAGADMIAIHSRSHSAKEIIEFAEKWNNRLPLMVIPTTYVLTTEQVNRLNIAMIVFANQVLRTVIGSVSEFLQELLGYLEEPHLRFNNMSDINAIFDLQRLERWDGLSQEKHEDVTEPNG